MFIAYIVSTLFNPMIGFFLLFGLAANRSGITGWDFVFLMSIFFLLIIVPPALVLLWGIKTKRISNWDISNRPQRVRALLVFALFLFFDYFVIQFLGTPLMKQVFVFVLIYFFGFFMITLRFKISGHMSTATLVLCILVNWYGISVLPLALILPLIAWSRLILKRHTVGEIVGGSVYSIVIYIILMRLGIL